MGTLPTRRALLYSKAVEVLLTTWNVEGHEPEHSVLVPDSPAELIEQS